MQSKSLPRSMRLCTALIAVLALVGCGSGNGKQGVPGTPQATKTGALLDSGLEGVDWNSTGGESGVTNSLGEFQYRDFELVTFSVCGIGLGRVEGAQYLTPVELTGSDVPTDQPATNQLVFLQSLDRDGDPSNGISIDRNTAGCQAEDQTLDFFDPDFASKVGPVVAALTDGANEVVSESAALLHFYQTYNSVGCTDNLDFAFPGFPACGDGITYNVKFSDEFDTGSAPSPDTWNIETGYGPDPEAPGWGNNEWQLYTDSPDNVRVEDGNLVIQAQCPVEPCGVRDGTITSARINTKDKFEFKFGTVQARIKPPVGKGAWPAFWSLGAVFPETPWPRAGEIDFMEMFNAFSDDRTTHFTMHWCDETLVASPELCSPTLGRLLDSQSRSFAESLGDDFHIFEADWDEQRIVGKIDGITYFTRTIDPATMEEFLNEFFLLLNVAMGGTLGSDNQPPDGTETWPQTMLVDYVRVFERVGGAEPIPDTIIDFEDSPDSYDFGPGGGFGGGASAVIANPVAETINTSPQVAQMLKFDAEDFGGSTLTLDSPVTLPGGRPITMKVWSPRVVDVLLKIEGPLEDEVTVTHGGSGWEELTFDFSAFAGTVEELTFIFDNGTNGDAENDPDNWTFYFDDILLPSGGGDGGGGGSGGLVTDFEQLPETYDFGPDGGFGGGAAQVIANPVVDGNNTSDQVARMLKFNEEPFGGATLTLSSTLAVPSGSSFTMKVWSPRVVDVLFKLEGGPDAETTVTHGGSGWETLTFDFSGISGSFTGITFIFDNGTNGDAGNDPDNWTFYFDDIILVVDDGGGPIDPGGPEGLVTDFEGPATSYNFGEDGGFEGGFAEAVANPFPGGINPSARVARMLKFAGADFAGSTLTFPTPETPTPLVVPLGSSFTMKVWSARSVDVLFQPEPQGPDSAVTVTHGGSGWEELTFDFPGLSGNVTGITFIFDNGTVGDAENDPVNWTFYIDDIFLVTPDDGEPPPADTLEDFEGDPASYTFNDFEGGVGSVIDNPNPGGINTSAQVGQMQKFAGADFAGSTLAVAPPVALAAADSYKMKVFSPREVVVTLKLEPLDQEATATHTGGSTWQELCFDFTGVAGTVNGYTLIFDNGTVGDAENDPDNWTFQFDDIEQTSDSCQDDGGGGGATTLPVDFEGDINSYDFGPDGGFDGGQASVIDNPQSSGINTSAQVGQMLKFDGAVFGGATLVIEPTTVTAGSSFTMKVWSQRPVPVLFQPEPQGPGSAVEVAHGGTGWEELTFSLPSLAGTVTGITVIFDNGTPGEAATDPTNWTFYFDDITLIPPGGGGGGGSATPLPVDFEGDLGSYDFGPDGGFEGGSASAIANPQSNGINTSAQVGQMQKFPGAVFAGATLVIEPTTVTAGSSFTMKVWSQRPVPVLFQPEPQGPGSAVEVAHGGTGWEELTFSLPSLAGTVTGITVIFDNGTAGEADTDPTNWTFYFDDITLVPAGGGGGGACSPCTIDFESGGAGADFGWSVFENAGDETLSVVANPDMNGNTSATVATYTARQAGAFFAGAQTFHPDGGPGDADIGPFDFDNSNAIVKVWVWKSVISPVGIQFVSTTNAAQAPLLVSNTLTDQWEELTFDFTTFIGTPGFVDTDRLVIFGDWDEAGRTQDNVIFFDNVTFNAVGGGGGGGGGTPVVVADFEGDPNSYDFGVGGGFEGGVSVVIDNPQSNGINTSAQVVQMQKFPGAVFGGSTLALAPPLEVTAGSSFTMKVWSQRPVPVLFQPEPQGPGSAVEVAHGGTGWEELTFSLPGLSGTVTGITVIFDNGTAGDAGNDPTTWTFYYDDITLIPPGGGGGGGGGGATTLPVDFEGDINSYDFGPDGGFDGGQASVIDNPQSSGINTSAQVGQMLKFDGAVFGGATLVIEPTTVTAGSSFTMKVWSQRPVPVLFQPEPQGPGSAVEVAHGGTGWEELTFSLPSLAGTVTGITVIFDNGTPGEAATDPTNWTFYFDDITLIPPGGGGGGGSATPLPVDFEGDLGSYDFGPDGGFEGGSASAIANPQSNGINTSAQVGQMQKFPGAVFAGATLVIEPTTVTAGSSFTMKVWSQRPVPVLFQPEPQGPGSAVEVAHGGTGWEELTFSLPSLAGTVTGITVIFDNGTAGEADTDPTNWTFYFDDITLVPAGGGGGGACSPCTIDFESGGAGADFGWSVFENAGDETLSVVANPDMNGNTSATVATYTARQAGAFFAGAQTFHPDGGPGVADIGPFDFDNSNAIVKVWVWKSVISPVGIQFVSTTNAAQAPLLVSNTLTDQWEELTFDFTTFIGTPGFVDTDRLVIFGDWDEAGRTQDNVIFFDNVTFNAVGGGGGGGGGTPVVVADFEGDPNSYDFGVGGGFEGGVSVVIDNPQSNGINTSAQVVQMQKFPGAVFGGSTLALAPPLEVTAGSSFTMKVWSQRPVPVLFQPEPQGPGSAVEVAHGGTGWEELTFSLPGLSGTVTGITVIFDNGTAGDAGNDPTTWTFYYDDITLIPPDGGGGGGGGGGATTLPVDFEGDINSYDFGPDGGFDGGQASVIDNPQSSGINTSAQVGQMLKFDGAVFGGATLVIEPTTVTAGSSFTMKVWSQRPVPVLFQPEPQGPGSAVEVAHGGTGWEELTFSLPSLAGTVTGITVIFDNGTPGEAATDPTNWTFYFDDITLIPPGGGGGGGSPATLPVDFEGDLGSYDFGPDGGFEGGSASAIANPQSNGINTSAQVGQMQKFPGAVFAGATLVIEPTTVTAGSSFTMKVWSQRPVPVLFQPEPQGPGSAVEVAHGGTGWEELTFSLPALAGTVTGITVIFDNGTAGEADTDPTNWTFYFDDITLVPAGGGGGGGGACSPCTIDFESGGAGADFGWSVFENAGDETLSVVANPDMNGNTSATVATYTARQAGAFFAGAQTFHPDGGPGEADIGPFDFDNSNAIVKVWVWKSVISPVGIQFVSTTNAAQAPLLVSNTLTDQWEELTFDFTTFIGTPGFVDTDRLVIFGDWDEAGRTQDNVIFFDEVRFTDGT